MLKKSIVYTLFTVALVAWLGREVSLRAQTGGAESTAATESAPQAPDTLLSIVFSGGIIGIGIMLILLAASICAAYLVFEHLMTIRRSEIMPEGLNDEVRNLLTAGNVGGAYELCRARPSFLSYVMQHGLAEVENGWSEVEKALEESLAEQQARLFRKIEYLSVIGNIAPMLGLLGTVAGMILAFQQVASTQGSAGAAELAQGIYSALVTTVAGLMVAIPSLAAFAVFRSRVDQFVAEAAYQAQHAFAPLKRRSLAGPALSSPPPAPPSLPGAPTAPRRA